jgi:hypothetical protein
LDQATFLRALKQERQDCCRDGQQTAEALRQGEQILISSLGFERRAEDAIRLLARWTASRA